MAKDDEGLEIFKIKSKLEIGRARRPSANEITSFGTRQGKSAVNSVAMLPGRARPQFVFLIYAICVALLVVTVTLQLQVSSARRRIAELERGVIPPASSGAISLSEGPYYIDTLVQVKVHDPDRNLNVRMLEAVKVKIIVRGKEVRGRSTYITLYETQENSDIFVRSIELADSEAKDVDEDSPVARLPVAAGETVEVIYIDKRTAQGPKEVPYPERIEVAAKKEPETSQET